MRLSAKHAFHLCLSLSTIDRTLNSCSTNSTGGSSRQLRVLSNLKGYMTRHLCEHWSPSPFPQAIGIGSIGCLKTR